MEVSTGIARVDSNSQAKTLYDEITEVSVRRFLTLAPENNVGGERRCSQRGE
jgi:hypothetical protein